MNTSPIRVGLIGAGRIGRLHAEHLSRRLPEAELVLVTDIDEAAARDCATRLGVPDCGTDYRKILERTDVSAVVICSSTDTHTRLIEDAAAAGKHIFCEKPIDADLARTDRAVAAAQKAGVLLFVGFNRRFDANFRRIRQAIDDGEIGTPHQLHIISRDPAPPPIDYVRRSGGLFLDMTIHDFDMAQFLLGMPASEVYAAGAVRVDAGIGEAGDIDTATVVLKFAGGEVAVIENCRKAVYGYDQRVEAFGSKGAIRVDNNYPNTAIVSDSASIHRDKPLHFFMDRYTESYLEEMRAFLGAIRSGASSPVPGEAGRAAVAMAHAALRSWRENRPIRLDEVG